VLSSSVVDVRGPLESESSNLARIRSNATLASEEEGLALLGDNTAAGDLLELAGADVDNSILDYESDGSERAQQSPQAK
jgi:hypothetical protein